ncbi:MAG: hypothetical protein C4527_15375 [Candidatus Omnitrophota bacterium]|nr:MAG: hypothetical protein C4527_15375 [Candidatus Omnitrophota bacterium]
MRIKDIFHEEPLAFNTLCRRGRLLYPHKNERRFYLIVRCDQTIQSISQKNHFLEAIRDFPCEEFSIGDVTHRF